MNGRPLYATTALAAYVATIPAANLLTRSIDFVPAGFGHTAPAGVYLVGLAFVLRDAAQQLLGHRAALAAVVAGAVLSYAFASPALAAASAAGFLISELADAFIYTRLLNRGLLSAVVASNTASLVLDSVLFLAIAFHGLQDLPGQVLAKTYMTLAAAAVIAGYRHATRQPA
jgi:uncharacterized PurR-regulated membrane protein YhhQ (DUF165 family)